MFSVFVSNQHSGSLKNNFDRERVENELNLQRTVSQTFSQTSQQAGTEINRKAKEHDDQAEQLAQAAAKADAEGNKELARVLAAQADDERQKAVAWQRGGVLLNMISAGLTAPTQSTAGIVAATASPALSYEIGQHFKGLAKENQLTGKTEQEELTAGQKTAHILAHAVLGAAVAAAGDNNALAGAISAGGAEAAAPYISKWLYDKEKGSDLTAEEKETVSAITSLLGAATGAAVGNSATDAAQGNLNAQSAVENNWLTSRTFRQNLSNRAKQGDTDAKRMLEIEHLLRQHGIQDIEDIVGKYNQNKDYETYKNAREHSDKIIASLIIQGLLTDTDIRLIEKESSNRRQAIHKGVPHTYISTAEVAALSPNTLDSLINPARRKRDNFTPTFATHLGEALFAAEMGNGSRGGKVKVLPSVGRKLPSVEVASTPSVSKMERGGGSRLATRERVNSNIQETRRGNQSSQFGTHAQRERENKTGLDFNHFIGGDINKKGTVTGGHSLARGDVRVMEQTSAPDKHGVYQATVEIKKPDGSWAVKTKKGGDVMTNHTMFPKDWDEARIRAEVTSAWERRKMVNQNKWEGKSSSGVWIEGFITPRGTAYPIYGR